MGATEIGARQVRIDNAPGFGVREHSLVEVGGIEIGALELSAVKIGVRTDAALLLSVPTSYPSSRSRGRTI